jgi:L-alanine-DL-glutamate epimerase-like enolase superfamily enzyme
MYTKTKRDGIRPERSTGSPRGSRAAESPVVFRMRSSRPPAWSTERHARTFRNAGGSWFIDQALWDIIGKAARLPLYKLWRAVRDRVQAYASTAELGSPENRAALAQRYRAEGFRAMKLRFHHDDLRDDRHQRASTRRHGRAPRSGSCDSR